MAPHSRLISTEGKSSNSSLQKKKIGQTRAFQVGVASWYGKRFYGAITASGKPFDMFAFTAAHPTLPMGTYVRVTSLENGQAVVVRVTDRGPFINTRIIDVSFAAARAIGFERQGLQHVRLDVLDFQMEHSDWISESSPFHPEVQQHQKQSVQAHFSRKAIDEARQRSATHPF